MSDAASTDSGPVGALYFRERRVARRAKSRFLASLEMTTSVGIEIFDNLDGDKTACLSHGSRGVGWAERVWKQRRSESGKFVEILQKGRGDGMESGMVIDRIMAVADESVAWGELRKDRGMNAHASRGSRQAVSLERGNLREKADFSALPRNDKGCLVALTRKQRGEMAEAAFLAKAAGLGFAVAKPWGESSRYDLIVDNGVRLLRVQVKSAHRAGEYGGYTFHAHGNTSQVYRSTEIDLLVAYVVPLEAWYLFPVEEFRKYKSMKLFPGSRRRRSKFEKFREAWWIMR